MENSQQIEKVKKKQVICDAECDTVWSNRTTISCLFWAYPVDLERTSKAYPRDDRVNDIACTTVSILLTTHSTKIATVSRWS